MEGQKAMIDRWILTVLLLVASLPATAQDAPGATTVTAVQTPVQYPASAVAAGEEGTVLVDVEVDAKGQAHHARIHQSSGYTDLDAAALQSMKRWSFRPATRNGEPMTQRVVVPVTFQLKDGARMAGRSPDATATISALLMMSGGLVWCVGFGGSVVLAKRRSRLWLSLMVALWAVTYPVFVVAHWSVAKRNLIVVLSGLALSLLGLYLAPAK